MASYVTFKLSSLTEMFADGDQRVETGSLRDAYRSSKKRQLAHIRLALYFAQLQLTLAAAREQPCLGGPRILPIPRLLTPFTSLLVDDLMMMLGIGIPFETGRRQTFT